MSKSFVFQEQHIEDLSSVSVAGDNGYRLGILTWWLVVATSGILFVCVTDNVPIMAILLIMDNLAITVS